MLTGIKSVTITEKMQVAIPKEMKSNKIFAPGKKIAVLSFSDRIELRPLSKITESLANTLLSEKSLSKEWLSKEDEKAWKNL